MTHSSHWSGSLLPLCFVLAACTPTAPPAKPGADADTLARDTAECRAIAQREAERLYPFGARFPGVGVQGAILSQQRDNRDRSAAEQQAFGTCMRNKGYADK